MISLQGLAQIPYCVPPSATLRWHHNERDGISNHQPHHCLLNRLFMCRSKLKSKLRVTGFCGGNSPVTGEFPTQRPSNAENVSIRWHHHQRIPQLLTHWSWDIMVTSLQITFSYEFYWLKITEFMMTSSNGSIFCVTGHLCGEFTSPRWIPHTKASDVELWCFLWSASE